MKYLIALIPAALFAFFAFGCDNVSQTALKQTRDDESFTMKVNLVSENKIEETCKALGVEYEANGCATFNLDTKVCNIYVMPQRYQQDEERLVIIGHETWHCRFGVWHG